MIVFIAGMLTGAAVVVMYAALVAGSRDDDWNGRD